MVEESIKVSPARLSGPFYILILDESEMIAAQFTSNLDRDLNASYKDS
jgi:hypothetical protein